MNVTRRGFLASVLAGFATAIGTAVLTSCGKAATGTGNGSGSCKANGGLAAIAGNHGHTLTVSAADVNAAADKTYDISGSAGHLHNVFLTAAHFATLAGGTGVTVTSTTNGHSHSVTVTCA